MLHTRPPGRGRRILIRFSLLAALLLQPAPALAHASDRGFVLLLPTGTYLAGGALAVALTFLVLLPVPAERLRDIAAWRRALFSVAASWRTAANWLSFASLAALLLAGAAGSRDPLANPLPLSFWTPFWIGLPLAQGTLGDLWRWLDPWAGPCRLARRFGLKPRLRLPPGLGNGPALLALLGFVWFELIDPAPDDPARLAAVLAAYWLASFAAMLAFGRAAWRRRGEAFSVLFARLARFAVTEWREEGSRLRLVLRPPGGGIAGAPVLPPSATLFLLLALAAVSFDGLSRTFLYLGAVGVNPLEYPGRSALVGTNTGGLLAGFAALAFAFLAAVRLGGMLAGSRRLFWAQAGTMIWSLVPIALAYQFAHYLAGFLVNVQYWLAALSDPFTRGWDLFGTAHWPIRAGVAAGSDASWAVWNAQALTIVAAHVLAVAAAHMLGFRLHPDRRGTALFLLPLTLLMILYTLFGLWLLSTPTGA